MGVEAESARDLRRNPTIQQLAKVRGNMQRPATPVGQFLGGGFKCFLFSPLVGEMIQFDLYFSNGLKPPTRI